MSNDLTRRTDPTAAPKQAADAASRLKGELMEDALGRMFDEDGQKTMPGTPRVILALANHAHTAGWDRAKVLQRAMFKATPGSGLEMKFAFYGSDNAARVRRCRITTRWITDPEDMAGVIDRAECNCGCYVHVRDVLAQAVKEAEERPLRAVIIVGDAFHDGPDGLDEAAISANRLGRAGTQVFLIQLSDDLTTGRRLQYLARVSGGAYFQFDPRTQERQFSEMWKAVSAYAAGAEEAVKMMDGQAANLLLQHLMQEPMPIIEQRARVRDSGIKERLRSTNRPTSSSRP
jgi:hypothetical protein